jgi:hypothetical protein
MGEVLVVFLCFLVLVLGVRGLPGQPNEQTINSPIWKEDGPLELSPDRGRYALIYSLVENKSFSFSLPIAKFVTPDLGTKDGKFVSLFAPALSFATIPGYIVGKMFNHAQVGVFGQIALFGLANLVLIRSILLQLGVSRTAGLLAGVSFLFATPAFAYAVSLYQHHLTTFLLLLSIFCILQRKQTIFNNALVWICIGFAVSVDYPNAVFFAPLGVYQLLKMVRINASERKITFSLPKIAAVVALVLPIAFFAWSNYRSYGNPLQLAGTVETVAGFDTNDKPLTYSQVRQRKLLEQSGKREQALSVDADEEKTAVGFFNTRKLLNGFLVLFWTPDRSTLIYAPLAVLAFFGLGKLLKKHTQLTQLLVATILCIVLLYSMWGDPWGGWAFGARYLIPAYALAMIFLGVALYEYRRNYPFIILFFILLVYGVTVNSIGALSSSRNPPLPEVLALERVSGVKQKYTFDRNLDFLKDNRSKSYLFQVVAKKHMHATDYLKIVIGLLVLVSGGLLAGLANIRFPKNLH